MDTPHNFSSRRQEKSRAGGDEKLNINFMWPKGTHLKSPIGVHIVFFDHKSWSLYYFNDDKCIMEITRCVW